VKIEHVGGERVSRTYKLSRVTVTPNTSAPADVTTHAHTHTHQHTHALPVMTSPSVALKIWQDFELKSPAQKAEFDILRQRLQRVSRLMLARELTPLQVLCVFQFIILVVVSHLLRANNILVVVTHLLRAHSLSARCSGARQQES